jgi:hypothetical protein
MTRPRSDEQIVTDAARYVRRAAESITPCSLDVDFSLRRCYSGSTGKIQRMVDDALEVLWARRSPLRKQVAQQWRKAKKIAERLDEMVAEMADMGVTWVRPTMDQARNRLKDLIYARHRLADTLEAAAKTPKAPEPGSGTTQAKPPRKPKAEKNRSRKTSSAKRTRDDETPMTLREFIQACCVPVSKNIRESCVAKLQTLALAQHNKIELKNTRCWKSGQSKVYLPSYLRRQWPDYIREVPRLPALKPPTETDQKRP